MNKKEFIESFGISNSDTSSYTFDNHLDVVDHIDNCFAKFSTLAYRLKFQQNEIKNVYLLSYVTAIANNFLVIRQLFVTGFHLQMEVQQRTQLEQLNNLLIVIYDDEFFKFFTKTWVRSGEDFMPHTPKDKHLAKAIKKIEFKNPDMSSLFKQLYNDIKESYEEFSKSVHGNLMHILLLTEEGSEDNLAIVRIGGRKSFLPRSVNYLSGTLDYSQIIYLLLEDKFPKVEDENIFEEDISELFLSVRYRSKNNEEE